MKVNCTNPRVLRPKSHQLRASACLNELGQSLRQLGAVVCRLPGQPAVDNLLHTFHRGVHVVITIFSLMIIVVES